MEEETIKLLGALPIDPQETQKAHKQAKEKLFLEFVEQEFDNLPKVSIELHPHHVPILLDIVRLAQRMSAEGIQFVSKEANDFEQESQDAVIALFKKNLDVVEKILNAKMESILANAEETQEERMKAFFNGRSQ